ncbi:hypothetical protein [Paenibacillus piri]|uniref:Uncharacterized protein n=1 Tax=Paenibacillus piri TaxID=2547395 RepID=A0A4R5KKS1_9BACL|nr:hypothetical protein [Paenibacillus piri]TDF95117.1 hypothetical protein E1757_21520 [Paenibacillus piri]
MTVEHDGNAEQAVIQTVQQADYTATPESSGGIRQAAERSFWRRNHKVVPTALSGLVFIITWGLELGSLIPDTAAAVLYGLAMVTANVIGRNIL